MSLYRYGIEFVDTSPETVDAASRMVQRYAVAMWYSLFERESLGRSPMLSRRGVGRAPFKVPVRLETPNGEVYSSTRDVSTEAMRCVIASPIDEEADSIRAEVYSPLGSIFAEVRVSESRDVTGPPHNVREFVLTFVSFDGQGRSMLQSLVELADVPHVRDDLMLMHEGQHRPLIRPLAAASIVLVALSPGAIGVFKHVHDDDLTLVNTAYQGDVDLTEDDLERILAQSIESEDPDVRRLLLLKDALDRDKRYEELVQVWQLIVAQRPDDPDMGKALVAALTAAGRYRESENFSQRWIARLNAGGEPLEAREFEILQARNMMKSGDEFGSLEVFRRLFVANPQDVALRSEYLGFLLEKGMAREAMRQFSQLPRNAESLRHQVSIQTALQNFPKAEAALRVLQRNNPEDQALRIELGEILIWQDEFDAAVQIFRELRQDYPTDLNVAVSLGEALAWSGSGDEALELFGKLMDDGFESDRLMAGFLDAYLGSENPSASAGHRIYLMYERHRHVRKLPLGITGRLASALVRANFQEEGIALLEAVLAGNPGDRDLRLRLADALVAAGRNKEAHHHYRALLSDAQNGR